MVPDPIIPPLFGARPPLAWLPRVRASFLCMDVLQLPYMIEQEETAIDLSTILKSSHENKWVAIAPDYSKVIAAADTLRELMRSVANKDAIYHRVLPRDVNFVPAA